MLARTLSGAREGWVTEGHNDDVDSAAEEDVWTGPAATWVAPTDARIHGIVSTDNVDDNVGGDGALEVTVEGLDADWAEQSETVVMTGTTPVNTQLAYRRINRMYVSTAGVNGVNAGAISAVAAVDSTTTSHMQAGECQSQQCVFTVPALERYLLRQVQCAVRPGSPAGVTAVAKVLVTDNDLANTASVLLVSGGLGEGVPLERTYPDAMPVIAEKTDVVIRVAVSADDTIIGAGFVLVKT